MRSALVTANVFQNALANRSVSRGYYATLLQRLAEQPVTWYMTEFDHALALAFWDTFRLGGDVVCQTAYIEMLRQIRHRCPIDGDILEGSNRYRINFCDALRVACARDRFLDCIVTWEPHQFASNAEQHNQVQINEFFQLPIRIEDAETQEMTTIKIGVFSVRAFLLRIQQDFFEENELEERRALRSRRSQYFLLQNFHLQTGGDTHEVAVMLCDAMGRCLCGNACGNSPIDALQKAIDQAVTQTVQLPTRYLSRWFVPPATLFGADSPVEVVVGVECEGFSYEESASHSNVFQAAAEAYVQVINRICCDLRFPDAS
ncbi:MAG: alpha-isopropylmalate synthase regulatory domain-containing protein [Leptolyngbyaceae cyanobacterium bins.302]|nr:alpha-isopropylmalate synthase regulatory domain-containing protein [Leptolyngbyaceae cyanobacterium bins.302]